MTIYGPPDSLQWVSFLMMGSDFPKTDEDGMRALAGVWTQLGTDLKDLAEQINNANNDLDHSGAGPAKDAAKDFLGQISGDADTLLPKLFEAIKDVAEGANKIALDVEYAKLTLILMAAYLLYTIMRLLYLAFFTAGESVAEIPVWTLFFQQLARRVLIQLIVNV